MSFCTLYNKGRGNVTVNHNEVVAMERRTAHLALYDTLADWEVGHLIAELRTGRFTETRFDVVTVAETRDPVTTMGGVRMLPDLSLDELDPAGSDLLILPGADMWDAGGGQAFAAVARRFLDGDLITAGPQSPVQFACATLDRLKLASGPVLEAYEDLFHRGDAAAFPVLMQAQGANR
jgi:hypothetical protein